MSVLKTRFVQFQERRSGSLVGSLSEIWPDQRLGMFDIEYQGQLVLFWIPSIIFPSQLLVITRMFYFFENMVTVYWHPGCPPSQKKTPGVKENLGEPEFMQSFSQAWNHREFFGR